MSSLYLPNPCLLGIILAITTVTGDEVVFHYPPFPKNYDYKPTPMGNIMLQTGDDDYSSDEDEMDDSLQQYHQLHNTNIDPTNSSSEQLASELASLGGLGANGLNQRSNSNNFNDSDVSSNEGGSRASFGSGSSFLNGNGVSGSYPGTQLSGKALLEYLDEQDRKKKKREEKRQKLMKNIIMGEQAHQKENTNDTSPLQKPSGNGGGDVTSPGKDGNGSGNNQAGLSLLSPTIPHKSSGTFGGISQTLNDPQQGYGITTPPPNPETSTGKRLSDPKISPDPTSEEHTIDTLFGLKTSLVADILTPHEKLCNTKFEFGVDDMTFLGLPVMSDRKTGRWRPKTHNTEQDTNTQATGEHRRTSVKKKEKKESMNDIDYDDEDESNETDSENSDYDQKKSKASSGKRKKKKKKFECPMSKFHLVFVTNPPVVQRNFRIDELYDNIAANMAVVLRFEQQRSNYVWKQVQLIRELKTALLNKPIEEQWRQIIEKSELAKVIATTYNQVSVSDIVNVDINGHKRTFQIPLITEFASLPPKQVEVLSGSTLNSISPFTSFSDDSEVQHEKEELMVHFALLLLDDAESISKDIGAERGTWPDSLIKEIKPTESLTKLAVKTGLGITVVRSFAKHLIFWRRAKAVLPVSYKNTYVVSPLAPMKHIHCDSTIFKQTFPAMPPLQELLSHLSTAHTKPKPLKSHIPSKDHREIYMESMAWLFKYGYVFQLYSFLRVKITKGIRVKVDEELEIERKKKKHKKQEQQQQQQQQLGGHNRDSSRELESDLIQFDDSEEENNSDEEAVYDSSSESESDSSNSKHKHVRNTDNTMSHSHRGDSKNLSSRSNTNPRLMPMGAAATARSNSSVTDNGGHANYASGQTLPVQFEEEEDEDTILIDPESATTLEKRWIAACVEGRSPEVTSLFYKLLKYMNGKWAMELFILKEGVSRHDVRKMMDAMADHIVVDKHCDTTGSFEYQRDFSGVFSESKITTAESVTEIMMSEYERDPSIAVLPQFEEENNESILQKHLLESMEKATPEKLFSFTYWFPFPDKFRKISLNINEVRGLQPILNSYGESVAAFINFILSPNDFKGDIGTFKLLYNEKEHLNLRIIGHSCTADGLFSIVKEDKSVKIMKVWELKVHVIYNFFHDDVSPNQWQPLQSLQYKIASKTDNPDITDLVNFYRLKSDCSSLDRKPEVKPDNKRTIGSLRYNFKEYPSMSRSILSNTDVPSIFMAMCESVYSSYLEFKGTENADNIVNLMQSKAKQQHQNQDKDAEDAYEHKENTESKNSKNCKKPKKSNKPPIDKYERWGNLLKDNTAAIVGYQNEIEAAEGTTRTDVTSNT
ncbi:unnamed protein product [Ambrosiozyma monospora]|uniref:Unnamed protein product n=1 Tax=Ambrosiozyma monospora TaxID=43982 RepID=A0ACB5SUW5_AMBMO|nr:unnamed protein product [Ambrosiozyma monospora]